jgi:hypothetical protein
LLAPAGKAVLFEIVSGAARLQGALLAPLPAEDRAHFMRCMKLIKFAQRTAEINVSAGALNRSRFAEGSGNII